ncbi:cell division protein FtsA [Limibaculum sp. FT325]|uniref:cell division protein FtsA n=1 Tax=Thermohalobaculum sediminis TaxID=2939436 RepID=UPI0020BE8055|nr:cell division protein FtsA [Limibaculum sediminis]MCL5777851.1 cell division protein FtsA [Limibaculum sediminis]
MNFAQTEMFRAMRSRLQTAIRRGRIGVIDIGSSKITCLVLRLDPARLAEARGTDQLGTSLFGAIEVVGARTVQSRGVKRGEIVDMDEAARAIRLALLTAEKMAAPRVERVDQVIVSFSGGRPQSFSTVGETETETGQVSERDISAALADAPEPPVGEGRQILHAQPVEITLDSQSGITDPRGMTGHRLSIALHVMTVAARPLANLMECVRRCDLDLAGVVNSAYAASLSALVEDEQRTGAVCIDMGGGSTSSAVFLRDHLICVDQIRFGGDHITADIASGLMMRQSTAERIKTLYGGVIPTGADERDLIDAPRIGEEEAPERRQISRGMLIGVIRPRVEETFRILRARLTDIGVDAMPGSSYVLTGAASQLPGVDEMATRILGRRPRIGRPLRIAGLPQSLSGPDSSAAVGLAIYALKPHDELWDFEAPRPWSARGRAVEIVRWFRQSW